MHAIHSTQSSIGEIHMPIPEERRNKSEDQNATDTKIATNFLLLSANRNQEDMDDASIKDRIKFLSLPKETATAHRQRELRTNRNLLKYLVFGMLTGGIYCIWQMIEMGDTLNVIISDRYKKKIPNYLLMSLLGLFTFFITEIIWWRLMSVRITNESERRGLKTYFTKPVFIATIAIPRITFILSPIGGIIAIPTLMHDMNALCADYNRRPNKGGTHEHHHPTSIQY